MSESVIQRSPPHHWIGKVFLIANIVLASISVLNAQPAAPTGFDAAGYDSHIELTWYQNAEPNLTSYRIYRSVDEGDYEFLRSVAKLENSTIDFVGQSEKQYAYKITAIDDTGAESDYSDQVTAASFEMTDDELLTMVQEYTFRYFWDFAHPVSGMARERNTTSIVTTGGTGFGIMGILVGMERGFVSYGDGVKRLLKIVSFLEEADRFHGVFPHWMNGATGEVIPFSEFDDGGDLVETAFLIQGMLTARQCIRGDTPDEVELRQKITQIWHEVDWNWYRKSVQQVLYWHWSPNYGWQMNHQIRGYNEAHIVYLLAIASPTHPVPVSLYYNGWAGGNYENGGTFYGYPLVVGPDRGGPLFFSHYSYLGFDPRYKKDIYANYFNNAFYHTLINRAYCIDNPENHNGYSDVCWGLTASDDPWGYLAHAPTPNRDNGTITPTAALSSMPYTPDYSMDALKYFYRDLGGEIWGKYGFYDAFNMDEDWVASSYLAIDQGPIIGMIENYRTGLLWDCFMANDEIQGVLEKLEFEPDSTISSGIEDFVFGGAEFKIYPNPAFDLVTVEMKLLKPVETVEIDLLDIAGRLVKEVGFLKNPAIGDYNFEIDVSGLVKGTYLLRLQIPGGLAAKKVLILK